MKFFIKTIYLIFIIGLFSFNPTKSFSRDAVSKYKKEEVSNKEDVPDFIEKKIQSA